MTALLVLVLLGGGVQAGVAAPPVPGQAFSVAAVEALFAAPLTYDISFLWFDNLAEGTLSLSRGGNSDTLIATLEARTLGVAAWLTRDRAQRYLSVMQLQPDGRLRSLLHEATIVKGKGRGRQETAKRYVFDHENRQVTYQRFKGGELTVDKLLPMSSGDPPNDILTAFFNFRAGAFGAPRPGGSYLIPAFSHKGAGKIQVHALPPERRPHGKFFPPGGLLCQATVDREVFDTGDGSVFVWFDESGRPERGMVENVIGLGNVRGRLR